MLCSWTPSAPHAFVDDEDALDHGLRSAALEVVTLEIEQRLFLAFDALGFRAAAVAAIFDWASHEARLRYPRATPFEVRLAAALQTRVVLERVLARFGSTP